MAIAGASLPYGTITYYPDKRLCTYRGGLSKGRDSLEQDVEKICTFLVTNPEVPLDMATNRFQYLAVIMRLPVLVGHEIEFRNL